MAAIAFTEWLNSGQEYTSGVALYAQHPEARPALLKLLQSAGDGPFTTPKLVEEITRLSQLQEQPVLSQPGPVVVQKRNENVAEDPEEVQALFTEKAGLYKEAMHHRSQLTVLPTREERFAAALIVKRNFRRIEQIWSDLKYYQLHGHLPPAEVPVAPADAATQRKRLTTLRTYISSKRGTPEKRASWAAEISQLELLLQV